MKRFFAMGCICLALFTAAAPVAHGLTPAYTVTGAYRDCIYHQRLSALPRTGDAAFDAVAAALSQLGYHEGNSRTDFNGANSAGNGNFTEYCRAFGAINGTYGYAWCAVFASWCLSQAGAEEAGGAFASCTLWVERLQSLGLYHTRASGYTPQAGDLIFYRSAGVARASDHVGLVRYTEGGRVFTVEGNSSDCVTLHDYALTDTYIVGYGHPAYSGKTLPVAAHSLDGNTRGLYTVTADKLHVRAGRGTGYVAYGTLSRGALIEVSEIKNGWGTVRYGGKTAYLSLAYATFTAPASYTVHYVSEGAQNAPRDATYWSFETATAADAPARDGYRFAGWQDAAGTRYATGEDLPAGDLSLTAMWTAVPALDAPAPAPAPDELAASAADERAVDESTADTPTEAAPAESKTAVRASAADTAERAAAWWTGSLAAALCGAWLMHRRRG